MPQRETREPIVDGSREYIAPHEDCKWRSQPSLSGQSHSANQAVGWSESEWSAAGISNLGAVG